MLPDLRPDLWPHTLGFLQAPLIYGYKWGHIFFRIKAWLAAMGDLPADYKSLKNLCQDICKECWSSQAQVKTYTYT